jgi:prolyl 4-hydroxylase
MDPLQLVQNSIVEVESFITKAECQALLGQLDNSVWTASSVIRYDADQPFNDVDDAMRSSLTANEEWFDSRLRKLLRFLETRIRERFGSGHRAFEPWQATRYKLNDHFNYHLDCGFWGNTKEGERSNTFLLYLDQPKRGGETHFRAFDRTVVPRAGKLLAWHNLLPGGGCNHAMIHAGLPVLAGRKTTLVTWERKRFRSPKGARR